MEDDREMRVDEAMIPAESNGAGDRDRERYSSSRRDDRDRDRNRSRSRDRYSSRRDDDREKHHRRSPSRSRSPRRHRPRSHSRSRSRSRDRDGHRDRHRGGDRRARFTPPPLHAHKRMGQGRDRAGGEQSVGGAMNAPPAEAEAHAKVSKRENRLYVGNLPYDCNYKDLEKFMSGGGGEVIFSEVLVTPGGQSKGCGIVEFSNPEDAKKAKEELADKTLLGRPVFIREDREENARFGAPPIPGKIGMATGEARNFLGPHGANPANRNLFIGNLPLQASWQDLKDLMRQAGEVIRTDCATYPDGSPKGNGTVVFVNPQDAKAAIEMFHGFDWFGNILEVREDRFAGMAGGRGGFRGGFRGAFAPGMGGMGGMGRGGFVPGFRGGFAPGFRGGFRGGRGGFGGPPGGFGGHHHGGPAAMPGGRNFTQDIYADYSGPEGAPTGPSAGGAAVTAGLRAEPAEPNQQILVRNLPWSTSNEDLVELFETVGAVSVAEILYDGTRSKGEGIVQFGETAEAQTASEKFTGYMYGGRPLDVQFNPRWHEFSAAAVKGGQTVAA